MGSSEERLRAADAAWREREQLVAARAELVDRINAGDVELRALAATLGKELADVERLSGGLAGQYRRAFAGPQLAREQQEAYEANARYQAALGTREELIQQIHAIDGRLAVLSPDAIASEQRAARDERRTEVLAAGGERASTLRDLEITLESIDIELTPLAEAIAAGHAVRARLRVLDQVFAEAHNDRGWRKLAETTARTAGGELATFYRHLAELPTAGELVVAVDPPAAFADDWIEQAFGRGDFAAHVRAAISHAGERAAFVQRELERIEIRHADVAGRRAAIARQHDAILNE